MIRTLGKISGKNFSKWTIYNNKLGRIPSLWNCSSCIKRKVHCSITLITRYCWIGWTIIATTAKEYKNKDCKIGRECYKKWKSRTRKWSSRRNVPTCFFKETKYLVMSSGLIWFNKLNSRCRTKRLFKASINTLMCLW